MLDIVTVTSVALGCVKVIVGSSDAAPDGAKVVHKTAVFGGVG